MNLLLLALSCSLFDGRPAPADGPGEVLRLDALPFAELVVPPDNLPAEAAHQKPSARIALDRGWNFAGTSRGGLARYTTPVPFRLRGLFFFTPIPGMRLLDAATGEELPYRFGGGKEGRAWAVDREVVTVYLPDGSTPPTAGAYVVEYPGALAREVALHRALSGQEPEAFVRARIYDGIASREGLLLPAPGSAAWDLRVPEAAELTFTSGIVRPELGFPSTDGADLTVTVTPKGGAPTPVHTEGLEAAGTYVHHRVDLSAYAGQEVRVAVTTAPRATADGDLVFLAEPVIATRKKDPVTVLMVFLDTVRPDHLSLYGYERDTSAAIDHLAGSSAVFRNARSVAPWTLPSSRTVLTGRYPEYWEGAQTLPGLLDERGFATGFVAGNVYLTANFEMDRDWDYHQVDGIWPSATATTDDALEWLDEHDGRDRLLQVHYMSAHLPYLEPASYRNKYAGPAVGDLEEDFERRDVRKAGAGQDPAVQQYVKDRYDNNIAYATDQVQRLIERLDDNDVLVLYADHGEEFWEHGGHEHGHTLFEELLRVPLVIRAPGVAASAPETPVSLLDLTPTILALVGAPIPPEVQGRSLVPLLRGEPGAEDPFRQRDLAFGHPLYGLDHWGVLHEQRKWTTTEGREALFDLTEDPGETTNLLRNDPDDSGAPYRRHLAEAVERPVLAGYRLTPTQWKGGPTVPGLWATCTVPGGFQATWPGQDPLEQSAADARIVSDREEIVDLLARYQITDHEVPEDAGAVELCWHAGWFGSREIYLVPNRPLAEVGHLVKCSGYMGDAEGGKRATMTVPESREATLGAIRLPINRILWDQRNLVWQFGISPAPNEQTRLIDGADPEMASMLEALGYVGEAVPTGAAAPETAGRCVPPAVQLPPMLPPPPPKGAKAKAP